MDVQVPGCSNSEIRGLLRERLNNREKDLLRNNYSANYMEAMDIFFNEGSGVVKIDKDDVNAFARQEGNLETTISIQFTNLPESIKLDATNHTTLKEAEGQIDKKDGHT